MDAELNKIKVSFPNYTVVENTDEEIKILETEKREWSDYCRNFVRELTIKKDKAIITTWLNALGDKELLDVYNWIKVVMDERGIDGRL